MALSRLTPKYGHNLWKLTPVARALLVGDSTASSTFCGLKSSFLLLDVPNSHALISKRLVSSQGSSCLESSSSFKGCYQLHTFSAAPVRFDRHVLKSQSIRMLSSGNTMPKPNPKPSITPEKDNEAATQVSLEGGSKTSSLPPQKDERSTKEKLKQAVRDYGATVIVFHVTMSLMSLGFFYVLVTSGLDVIAILDKLGIGGSVTTKKVTEEASKFVVAYAIHKVFAPARIAVTLGVTPLIVRKLRKMGVLKVKPAVKDKTS